MNIISIFIEIGVPNVPAGFYILIFLGGLYNQYIIQYLVAGYTYIYNYMYYWSNV